ncbi:MAG: LysE family translocator [Saccharospirillum sp.]
MAVDWAVLSAFVVFSIVVSITPGPNNLMVMASGATFGVRATLPHLLGIATGFAMMLIVIAFGLVQWLSPYPQALAVVKWLGVLWLIHIGLKLVKPILDDTTKISDEARVETGAKPISLLEAALFQWVNPKAWVMALAAIAGYSALAEPSWLRVLLMAAVFMIVAPICNGVWLFAGNALRIGLQNPLVYRVSLLVMVILVWGSAIIIAFS